MVDMTKLAPAPERPFGSVSVPSIRLEQLRKIAELEGRSVARVLDDLVSVAAVERLPKPIPGFSAEPREGFVSLEIPGYRFPPVSPKLAVFIADNIDRPLEPNGGLLPVMHVTLAISPGPHKSVLIGVIRGSEAKPENVLATTELSASFAADFGRIIRKAAAGAEQQRQN